MKKISILFFGLAALLVASCTTLSNAASSNAAAAALGQQCGTSIVSLYNSYKAAGKLNMADANNIANTLTVASCYVQLKKNKDNASYRQAFTSGMVAVGAGVITNNNADALTAALLNANGLTNVNQNNVNQSSTALTNVLRSLR